MASFNYLNYYLRPNKNVERKLIFDALQKLITEFSISNYRYIGLGSMWFVDFHLAHKLLSIDDLISIEKEQEYISRKKFNKPYNCIAVEEGETSLVIPKLNFDDKNAIVWFDYDSSLDGPVWEDINLLSERVQSGSIIIVTINAHKGILKNLTDTIDKEKQFEELESMIGNYLPQNANHKDLSLKKFPPLMAKTLLNKFKSSLIASGRDENFIPLFNFSYRDNSPMITVGGMVGDEIHENSLEKIGFNEFHYLMQDDQFEIDVPPLTMKEKKALDQLLPNDDLSLEDVEEELNFKLEEEQIKAYKDFYKFYPIYGELQI